MSESKSEAAAKGFVAFPVNCLVSVFHSVDALDLVIDELTKKGFAGEDIRSFVGEEGIQELDFEGSAHGWIAELLRNLQHIGPSRTYLDRYEKYMRDGDSILMVHAPQEEQKQIAADIMKKHSAHRVTYFGTLVIEEV